MLEPLLEGVDLKGARGILVNISASRSLKLSETKKAMASIRSFAAEDANIICGTVYDDNLGDELRVTVVATGLGRKPELVSVPPEPEVLGTGTDGGPIDTNSGFGTSHPDVWRGPKADQDLRKKAIETITALEKEGVETFDIPAFIRKQAD